MTPPTSLSSLCKAFCKFRQSLIAKMTELNADFLGSPSRGNFQVFSRNSSASLSGPIAVSSQ